MAAATATRQRSKGKGNGKDKKNVPCRFYANGSYKLGDKSPYSHRPKADAAPAARGRSPTPRGDRKKEGANCGAACVPGRMLGDTTLAYPDTPSNIVQGKSWGSAMIVALN